MPPPSVPSHVGRKIIEQCARSLLRRLKSILRETRQLWLDQWAGKAEKFPAEVHGLSKNLRPLPSHSSMPAAPRITDVCQLGLSAFMRRIGDPELNASFLCASDILMTHR
jgi:hypothetical protein